MLSRIRISVPDAPGSLGRVTTAIGAAGGDIAKVDVLESAAGRALDDVFVNVRDDGHLRGVVAAVNFHRTELWRLAQVGSVLGSAMTVRV